MWSRQIPRVVYVHHRCIAIQQRSLTSTAPLRKNPITIDTVFSKQNIQRCKSELIKIKPFRGIKDLDKRKDVTKAAVLVPLCVVNGQPSVLLTKRSDRLSSHSGQVSFPGGMVDENDIDRAHTALRETEEEIGLHRDQVQVWGKMQAVPGRNLTSSVTPIVAYCGELDVNKLAINQHEVNEVFTRSLNSLCDANNYGYTHFRGDRIDYRLPVFTAGPNHQRIWGLSACILHMALRVIVPNHYFHDV